MIGKQAGSRRVGGCSMKGGCFGGHLARQSVLLFSICDGAADLTVIVL